MKKVRQTLKSLYLDISHTEDVKIIGTVVKMHGVGGTLLKGVRVSYMKEDGTLQIGHEGHIWIQDNQPIDDVGCGTDDRISLFGKIYPYRRKRKGTRDFSVKDVHTVRIENYEAKKHFDPAYAKVN